MRRFGESCLLALGLLLLTGEAATAQPFAAYLVKGGGHGYVEVPHSTAFDFTTGFTFEAWVSGSDTGACSSIAGKDFTDSWWIGVCGTSLRSYIKGTASRFTNGTVPANELTHVAVTYDGAVRKHYIDGELVASNAETGPMGTSTTALRLDSDTAWPFSYAGVLDEVRIWNVARTIDQIRSTINTTIDSPQPGLVAVYHLDANGVDSIGGHNGATGGTAAYLTSPVSLSCGASTATQLCVTGSRFAVSVKWLTAAGARGVGTLVPTASTTSGIFWFFGPDNWEVMVKVIDACVPPFNRFWAFSAATTDVHYQLVVTDVKSGQTKRYFNYLGHPAPATTDADAFDTCPE